MFKLKRTIRAMQALNTDEMNAKVNDMVSSARGSILENLMIHTVSII